MESYRRLDREAMQGELSRRYGEIEFDGKK